MVLGRPPVYQDSTAPTSGRGARLLTLSVYEPYLSRPGAGLPVPVPSEQVGPPKRPPTDQQPLSLLERRTSSSLL